MTRTGDGVYNASSKKEEEEKTIMVLQLKEHPKWHKQQQLLPS